MTISIISMKISIKLILPIDKLKNRDMIFVHQEILG